ncbi:GAF domain-containing protein [Micromonospora sp. SH-82]|uniref:GAF domain-containing protein n=1 Tax=Micromonospora sp. SH-82 TaxID=3132938 RepID=UPI003EC11A7B
MTGPGQVAADLAVFAESDRLAAIDRAGLGARPDPWFDSMARIVTRVLQTPVALVTMVLPDRQVFPGLAGLPEPWAVTRQTSLEESFCKDVVLDGALVVADARIYAKVRDSRAIADLGVVAYAGLPLTDLDGRTLGALCAIDTSARAWSRGELRDLGDLAVACTAELRLRILLAVDGDPLRPGG